jgi:Domain of unknown function (DUF4169)
MAEIVNLRRVRKAKARLDAASRADANRAKHGVSKPARQQSRARIEKLKQDLSARKLERAERLAVARTTSTVIIRG